jgi:circadian clock protein KaiC
MRGTMPQEVKPDAAPADAGPPMSPTTQPGLVPSGIRPLDYRVGGILPGRPYVISGNPGTGKSVSCLEFAQQGLESGETVVLITHDDPADVMASAAFLGIEIERPLREERLILLRFQLDFVRRLGRATTADAVFVELKRHLDQFKVGRIAIDSIVPFLDGGAASTMAIYALIQFLDELEVTSLLTFPGDMAGLYDRRLEPLMQRSAGVFHLSSDSERNHKLEVRKIRYDATSMLPVTFRVLSGAGMVVITDADSTRIAALPEELQHRLALVNMADALPNELVNGLRHSFEVDVRTGMVSAFSDLVRDGVGALLLNVRRDVIESALQLIRDLRQKNNTVPVVLITPYVLRSADRTRALRAGADDFLSSNLAPGELVARLQTIVKRGHWHDLLLATPEPGIVLQPMTDGTYEPMNGESLTRSVRSYLEREQLPFFTLFLIKPEKKDAAGLAKLALDIVRVESGDLVGILGKRVITYLDSARPKDLASLKIRMREHALRLGYGDIEIEALGFPANEDAVRDLLGAPAAS